MANITLEHLRARRQSLLQAREENLQKLERLQEQETGFKFVIGEIEQMIEALEQDERAEAERSAPAGAQSEHMDLRDDGQLAGAQLDQPAEPSPVEPRRLDAPSADCPTGGAPPAGLAARAVALDRRGQPGRYADVSRSSGRTHHCNLWCIRYEVVREANHYLCYAVWASIPDHVRIGVPQ